jgi:flagellar L-ring protein precursor FlgH
MNKLLSLCLIAGLLAPAALAAKKKKDAAVAPASPLDRYVSEAKARSADAAASTPGSIWLAGSRLADSARDLRASQVDDVLTVVVAEAASAVTSGVTQTQRASSLTGSLSAASGITKTAKPLTNSVALSGNTQLNGQGTTSRTTTLTTTLTARVIAVLPNGALVVEASKDIQINSEHQTIMVRGVIRPADIDSTNSVQSNRLGELELRVNGKGVVGDSIRRPNILYRALMGILPF